ncbi:MAG: DNA mismatch repair protein MutS [Spirochaetes bacterium]|nr:DNA mismatch repair protein MutS [Spirochaetota bacterium]
MESKTTPAMKQFLDMKRRYREEILFFRMGDFYEMFFDDAREASKILDIALTSRQNDIPMCGIPYHAAESYIARLIKAGRRVAICEQMEAVPSSGPVVKREVVRVITPGTLIEDNLIQSDDNNYLASIIIGRDTVAMAFVDVSTGDFSIASTAKSIDLFRGEIMKYNPREAVVRDGEDPSAEPFIEYLRMRDIPVYRINDWLYDTEFMRDLICETYGTAGTSGLGITDDLDIMSAGAIIQYLRETHKKSIEHLKFPRRLFSRDTMVMDDATITNLELVRNLQDGSKHRTLFSVLDRTRTAMGKRALERNILQPLTDTCTIEARLDTVQELCEDHDRTARVSVHLKEIHDIERLLSRFIMGKPQPRNFIALMHSIQGAMKSRAILLDAPGERVAAIAHRMPDLEGLARTIGNTVEDEPALTPEQGRVIRRGFNPDLDRIYELKTNAKNWIVEYQEEEKKSLGVPSLKIRYNKILGYYIEVSKAQARAMPETYLRKQTLVGSERFTTEKLQSFETEILSASEKIIRIETEEIDRLTATILASKGELQSLAETIGELDYLSSLATVAMENRYVRPVFNDGSAIHIREGRHPVVEKYYTREVFIPNDVFLDGEGTIIAIITGPNMSGKSTYIRMAAMIQLMAQIGSFVPAREAVLSAVDRIFTRIGASDNISRGESTFLVEMNETAHIVNNATPRSLIVMDEIGRGTSTYDGLSIAWAVVEYLLGYLKAKTLFATHYHELTRLGNRKGVVNLNVLVRERMNGIDFLHKIAPGAADKSYGIHVANLAGIPKPIISRAEEVLRRLEKGKSAVKQPNEEKTENPGQLEIFNASNHLVIQAVKGIDLDAITPLDALNELNRLKKLIE